MVFLFINISLLTKLYVYLIMELTGQCKIDFEKWFLKDVHTEGGYDQYLMRSFNSKIPPMKFSVFVDFFDENGIEIYIKSLSFPISGNKKYYVVITDDKSIHLNNYLKYREETRILARKLAIVETNKLYNERINIIVI